MNKDMKKFALQLLILILIVSCLIVIGLLIITQLPVEKYRTSYQYVLNRKYEQLVNTNEPKIILIGGSNLAFGIDENVMEEKIGMPVVNLGLHAGFGIRFNTEIAKANINEGDIIVLVYECSILNDLSYFTPELVVSGIDDNIEMYKYVPKEYWPEVIKYIPTYVLKKIDAIDDKKITEIYNTESFDEEGNMILQRDKCILPEYITPNYNEVRFNDENNISDEAVEYINDFYEFCIKKGAIVLYSFPSILDERFYATEEQIESYEQEVDEELLPTRISNIRDYVFERKYMYDTILHLNSEGANIRSKRLADDILKYLNGGGNK